MFAKVGCGNPWGHVFDTWGQSFFIDNPRINYLSPSTGNSGRVAELMNLAKTEKQCGGDLVTGTHMPEELQGQLLTGRFKSRTVIRYEFIENGAGFDANVLPPLVASRHPNFRPVDTKIGPDGAVYVADWYNSIINHAQHNFRDPRRDHSHGRIWRITHKQRPLAKKPKLVGQPTNVVLDALKSPNAWTRHQARGVLGERDRDEVLQATEKWVASLDAADVDYDRHLVEAMWACQNVERVSETILKKVLGANTGHARAAGARVIRYWHDGLSDPIALIKQAASDEFPRTRMEAILSAGFIPKAEAYTAALHALDHERDKAIDIALKQTVIALETHWRPALEADTLKFAKPEHKTFSEQSAGLGFDKQLAAVLKSAKPKAEDLTSIRNKLPKVGNTKHATAILNAVTSKKSKLNDAAKTELLAALYELARDRQVKPRKPDALGQLTRSNNDALAAAAARNLGAAKAKTAEKTLTALLGDAKRGASVRTAAARGLAMLASNRAQNTLETTAKKGDVVGRYAAITGLIAVNHQTAADAAASVLMEDPGTADAAALIQAFIARQRGTKSLAEATAKTTPHPKVTEQLAAYHRQTGQLPKQLLKLAESANAGQTLSKRLLAEAQNKLTAAVEAQGNADRGEMIYRRKALACTSCHGIGPVGPAIGPNLAAVGGGASTDYIVEAILKPNASIAEHYENVMIQKADGSVINGVITFKSNEETAVRSSAHGGDIVRIPAREIKKTTVMPSLMPAGLADQLKSRQEFLDLAKFVAQLGRPGPYANNEAPFLRKWRLAPATNPHLPPATPPALPAYSKVGGELPAEDLNFGADHVFAQSFVNVRVPGSISLEISDVTGLQLWVDKKQITDLSAPIHAERGRRTLTFIVDRNKRGNKGLQVKVIPAPSTGTKLRVEGGI
jgi:putative heme-binding domain-containing protein